LKPLLTVLSAILILLAVDVTSVAGEQRVIRHHHKHHSKKFHTCVSKINQIGNYREKTWQLQKFMGKGRTLSAHHERKTTSCEYVGWIANVWKKRARNVWTEFQNPPHKAAWWCIHSYEGSWTDPNAPYYGGLQMDYEFQQAYGLDLLRAKGTADHWTPLEQMWVAERAYVTRGFYPWPTTARFCHLI